MNLVDDVHGRQKDYVEVADDGLVELLELFRRTNDGDKVGMKRDDVDRLDRLLRKSAPPRHNRREEEAYLERMVEPVLLVQRHGFLEPHEHLADRKSVV